jgi:hypothetical protein
MSYLRALLACAAVLWRSSALVGTVLSLESLEVQSRCE